MPPRAQINGAEGVAYGTEPSLVRFFKGPLRPATIHTFHWETIVQNRTWILVADGNTARIVKGVNLLKECRQRPDELLARQRSIAAARSRGIPGTAPCSRGIRLVM